MNKKGKDIRLYYDCLCEIVERVDKTVNTYNSTRSEDTNIFLVESMCLHIRKVLEITVLLSLVANRIEYSRVYSKFANHYHPKIIMRDLKRINPKFYPTPIKKGDLTDEGNLEFEIIDVEDGFLTQDELIRIYKKCGGIMHAKNPFSGDKDIDSIRRRIPEWINKICALLNQHLIYLVDGKTAIAALLKRADTGLPQVIVLENYE